MKTLELAPRVRPPTLRAIMRAKGCSREQARTRQAIYECDADEACFRATGIHSLKPYHDLDELWRDLES